MDIQIGQKYKIKEDTDSHCGSYECATNPSYIVITAIENGELDYDIFNEAGVQHDNCWGCFDSDDLIPFESNNTMAVINKLTKEQKEAWTKDQQALYRVGINDCNGNIANTATAIAALVKVNHAALVAQAEAEIKEAEAEEKTANLA